MDIQTYFHSSTYSTYIFSFLSTHIYCAPAMCQAPFDALGKDMWTSHTESLLNWNMPLLKKIFFFRIQIQTVLSYSEGNNPLWPPKPTPLFLLKPKAQSPTHSCKFHFTKWLRDLGHLPFCPESLLYSIIHLSLASRFALWGLDTDIGQISPSIETKSSLSCPH